MNIPAYIKIFEQAHLLRLWNHPGMLHDFFRTIPAISACKPGRFYLPHTKPEKTAVLLLNKSDLFFNTRLNGIVRHGPYPIVTGTFRSIDL